MDLIGFDFKNLDSSTLKRYDDHLREEISKTFDGIVECEDTRTFENTVQPMINLEFRTQSRFNSFSYAKNYYPDKETRDTATELLVNLQKFMIDQNQRMDVYNAFNEYEYDSEKESLTPEEVRYYEHTVRDFRRSGLHLTENKEEFIRLEKRLAEITTQFSKNLNDEHTSFEMTREELDGMPDSWFNEDRLVNSVSDSKTKEVYKMTLKYPDYVPALKYCTNRETRKQLCIAFNDRCKVENTPLFVEAVKIRYQIAKILGYKNHADYSTEVKVVKNANTAIKFIEGLNELFTDMYHKDMENALTFAKSDMCEPHTLDGDQMFDWDRSYYNRLYIEHETELNMEELRQYFPLDVVRDGIFKIYQTILGLKFTKVETDNVWHPDVEMFSVTDDESDELMGYFFLDMYPRDGKYGHACASDFLRSCDMSKINGTNDRRKCVISMICNFPKGECISFGDVETFFHEFGHVMHEMCSKPQIGDFSGFGTEWDFVEAPSQMLENWCYESEPLKLMSKHTETGECVPDDIIEKLKASKKVLAGYSNKRQFMFGIFDLKVHTLTFDNDESFDPNYYWNETCKQVLEYDPDTQPGGSLARYANFGHLMGGYDAGYYGYKRAETYSANMFHSVFKGDCMSREKGMRYRTKLLEPGSTKDGVELIRDFLGEEPDDKYFLIDQGL